MTWPTGPSVAEERAEAVRAIVPSQPATAWKHYGLLLRIVFTVLAAIAVAAAFGFFTLLQLPPNGIFTAILAIGTAEHLIRKYHFFRTGVESSLWLCGTFAFIFGLPSQGKVEAILVFAAAAALSGWRTRNEFFGLLAAILVVVYVAAKWEHTPILAMSVAALIAISSACALRRVWQRPSTEHLFAGLALAMPVTGYVSTIFMRDFGRDLQIAAIVGGTAAILFAAGIAWRDRVLLISGTLSIACAAIELREFFDYPAEAKFIGAGIVVIAIAVTLERALRGKTRGFVVTAVATNPYDEAMQIGGIVALAPHGTAPADHAHTGPVLEDSTSATDKSFGGAGAGGGY